MRRLHNFSQNQTGEKFTPLQIFPFKVISHCRKKNNVEGCHLNVIQKGRIRHGIPSESSWKRLNLAPLSQNGTWKGDFGTVNLRFPAALSERKQRRNSMKFQEEVIFEKSTFASSCLPLPRAGNPIIFGRPKSPSSSAPLFCYDHSSFP